MLPLRTRLRLRSTGRIDHIASRLIAHGHNRAAVALWRACGLWHP